MNKIPPGPGSDWIVVCVCVIFWMAFYVRTPLNITNPVQVMLNVDDGQLMSTETNIRRYIPRDTGQNAVVPFWGQSSSNFDDLWRHLKQTVHH